MTAPETRQCRCGHDGISHEFSGYDSACWCLCPEFRPVETGETLTRKGIESHERNR